MSEETISYELHPPFSFLSTLVDVFSQQNEEGCRSEQITSGVPDVTHPKRHQIGVEQFLEMLRFDQRSKLEELPGSIK